MNRDGSISNNQIIRELNIVKCTFQLRAITIAMGVEAKPKGWAEPSMAPFPDPGARTMAQVLHDEARDEHSSHTDGVVRA